MRENYRKAFVTRKFRDAGQRPGVDCQAVRLTPKKIVGRDRQDLMGDQSDMAIASRFATQQEGGAFDIRPAKEQTAKGRKLSLANYEPCSQPRRPCNSRWINTKNDRMLSTPGRQLLLRCLEKRCQFRPTCASCTSDA